VEASKKKFWGILSTAEVWYFVQYSRTDRPPFIVSQPLTVSMHNEASFNPLLDILYAFLLYAWSDATKENLESMFFIIYELIYSYLPGMKAIVA